MRGAARGQRGKAGGKIAKKIIKRLRKGRATADQHIIGTRRRRGGTKTHRLAQAPADAIALRRIAHFLRHREAKTRRLTARAFTIASLQQKPAPGGP